MNRIFYSIGFLSLGLFLFLSGCGKRNEFSTTRVNGVVTCNGTPVSGGTIMFTPINTDKKSNSGKPASGEIDSQGQFILTTYTPEDGAIVGRHHVQILPPALKDDHSKPVPYPCSDSTVEIEIQNGTGQDIRIEMSGS